MNSTALYVQETTDSITVQGNNTLSLTDNWLTSPAQTNWSYWTYPHYHYHYCQCRETKVRLTLKEVDRLRRAAKKDDKLKAVLAKLTDLIEVDVSEEFIDA